MACSRGEFRGRGGRLECVLRRYAWAPGTIYVRAWWINISQCEERLTCAPDARLVLCAYELPFLRVILTRLMGSRFILSTGRAVASISTFLRFYPYQLQDYMYVQHLYITISYVSTTFKMLRLSSSSAQRQQLTGMPRRVAPRKIAA